MSTADQPAALDIIFASQGLTTTEVAAVTAVLSAAVAEQASDREQPGKAMSAWERSARKPRMPIRVAPGAWRSFSDGGY